MQLVGRPLDEATLFRIGHQYQQRTAWHRQVPPASTD
jgi:aspartyl-tRNA(Asn)/glutamyl-tRNA(Gln) amidotransferase subunit A